MGRSIDQDVHAAFVEFRAKGKLMALVDVIGRIACSLWSRYYHAIQLQ